MLEDYSNIIILGVIFYYLAFIKIDNTVRKISLFLFIINLLDIIHLGLSDLEYFTPVKLLLAYIIVRLCSKYVNF